MVIVKTDKILANYSSEASFCRAIGLKPFELQNLKNNKSGRFDEDSKAYKNFRRLEQMGFAERVFENSTQGETK